MIGAIVPVSPKNRWEPLVTSGMARGGLWFVAVLSVLFWALYAWTLTQDVRSYFPTTSVLCTVALVPSYLHLKKVKSKEAAERSANRLKD
jgi:hypothetical protein